MQPVAVSLAIANTRSKVESDPEADEFQQNAEVESELRAGNGALNSAYAEDDELVGGNERGKKALNAGWKKYRRGIEWRCRWLEIRLKELSARSERYDRLLAERRARKSWVANVQPGEESSARSAQMVDSPERGRVLRRMRRNRVENTVDLDLYMAMDSDCNHHYHIAQPTPLWLTFDICLCLDSGPLYWPRHQSPTLALDQSEFAEHKPTTVPGGQCRWYHRQDVGCGI
ncbi:unnamed protein product [Calypogeia fissa]